MNITPTNINTYSPNEVLNNFANIFEKSRSINDLVSIKRFKSICGRGFAAFQ